MIVIRSTVAIGYHSWTTLLLKNCHHHRPTQMRVIFTTTLTTTTTKKNCDGSIIHNAIAISHQRCERKRKCFVEIHEKRGEVERKRGKIAYDILLGVVNGYCS